MKKTKEQELQEEMDKQAGQRAAEKEERERLLAEHKKEAEEARKRAEEATARAAKAEGMAEAMKLYQEQVARSGGNREWTEEQWAAFEEKIGIKKEALVAIDNAFGQKMSEVERKFEERARQAEERAKQAETKYAEFEKTRTYEATKNKYFKEKPQFARYEKEIDEFLADYPAETRNDPAKLEKLLTKAEVYVKGRVGDKGMYRNNGGSARFGAGDEENTNDESDIDLSDLRSHERATVEKIIPTKDRLDELKKYKHDLKGDNGVMISGKHDYDKYK